MNRIMSIEKMVTGKNIEKMVKRMSIENRDYRRKRTMEMLDCQKYDAPSKVNFYRFLGRGGCVRA